MRTEHETIGAEVTGDFSGFRWAAAGEQREREDERRKQGLHA
jgi:hypothetical protein